MMFKQIKFSDDEDNILGGLGFFDENNELQYIVCGCCGGILEPEDVTVLKIYPTWVDLSDAIIGDD